MDTPILFPVIYEDPKKQQAYTLIVYRGYTQAAVAEIIGTPTATVTAWMEADDWIAKREEHLVDSRKAAAASVGMQISARSRKMTAKVLSIQHELLEKVQNLAKEATSPAQVASVAKTLANLYSVYSGLLGVGGVTEKPADLSGPTGTGNAPSTLVQVNVLADLVRAGEAKAGFGVTVNGEEVDATQIRG